MEEFKNKKYYVYRNLISTDHALSLALQFKMLRNLALYQNNHDESKFVDSLVTDNCFVWYAPVDHLLEYVQQKIESVTKKSLFPTYSFGRIYYKNAIMEKHTDRPACEYSATLNASIDGKPWPMWIKNNEGIEIPIDLYPGDALIYMGQVVPHWRNPYTEGNEQVQFFLHWVDSNNENSHWKYDKRIGLGFPANTSSSHE